MDWTGWRKLQLSLPDFQPYEQPAGWQQIDALYFFTKIFDRQPNPYTVLALDDMQLSTEPVRSDPLAVTAAARPAGTIPVSGQAPAFDPEYPNHRFGELRGQATAPIQVKAYFQAERALSGYYPRYHPGYVSFSPQGDSYLQYSAGIIQTRDPEGRVAGAEPAPGDRRALRAREDGLQVH